MSITIRPVSLDDIPALARIHVPAKQKAYAEAVDADFLAAKTFEEYEQKWQNFMAAEDADQYIAHVDDKPAGMISFGRLRTPPPGTSRLRPLYAAEIFGIHVHPEYWKSGVGKALLQKAVVHLKEQKLSSLCLWVIEGNTNARGFYDHMGGQRIGKRMIEVGPSKVKELCYGWRKTDSLISRDQ